LLCINYFSNFALEVVSMFFDASFMKPILQYDNRCNYRSMEAEKDFNALFRNNYEQLYFFARKFLDDPSDCEDIVNDAFEEIWKNFSAIKMESARSYLYTVVRTRCIDRLRHMETRRNYARLYATITERYASDEGIREMEEREKQMGEAINSLKPPSTREIFIACYVDKKRYKQVADELTISVNTVKKHIVSALKQLKERRTRVNVE